MRILLGLSLLIVLSLGFVACGGDDDGNGSLEIIDLEVGDGAEVQAGDTITIHYTGTLEDGTVFDTSVGGDPATFPLSGLIQGWQDGIPGMKEGGTRRLIIPPDLAYGEVGSPPSIPGNATITFEIELISIEQPTE